MSANIGWLRFSAASVVIAVSAFGAISARATDVVTEWSTIQMPPSPTLKPVTVDSKSTALFLLDFMHENCGQRPRCAAAVPTIKALHDRARAAGMFVAYTLPGGGKIIMKQSRRARASFSSRSRADQTNSWATISISASKPAASKQSSSVAPRPKVSGSEPARVLPNAATT